MNTTASTDSTASIFREALAALRTELNSQITVEHTAREADRADFESKLDAERTARKADQADFKSKLDDLKSKLEAEQKARKADLQTARDELKRMQETFEATTSTLHDMLAFKKDEIQHLVKDIANRTTVLETWSATVDTRHLNSIWLRAFLDEMQAILAKLAGLQVDDDTDTGSLSREWRTVLGDGDGHKRLCNAQDPASKAQTQIQTLSAPGAERHRHAYSDGIPFTNLGARQSHSSSTYTVNAPQGDDH
jgi:hypothetical protein